MALRSKKRAAALTSRRERPRRRSNEFSISAAAYPDGRFAVLLSRYPELSDADFKEVLGFIRKARASELRRLRSSGQVGVKLDRFLVDHRDLLPSRRERFTWTTVAILMLLLMSWLFWDRRPHPLSQRQTSTWSIEAASGLPVTPHREAGSDPRHARQS